MILLKNIKDQTNHYKKAITTLPSNQCCVSKPNSDMKSMLRLEPQAQHEINFTSQTPSRFKPT